MDWLLVLLLPISGAVSLAGLLGVLAALIRWQAARRYRLHVNRRLYRYVRRRKARHWTCRKCGLRGHGPAPMGPVCQDCWLALDEYMSEVA